MTLWCAECGRELPEGPIPPGRLLADGVMLLRLVRSAAGRVLPWGLFDATVAPAVPLCENLSWGGRPGAGVRRKFSDCLGKLFTTSGVAYPDLPEKVEERLYGWAPCANRFYVFEYALQRALPVAYKILCGLELRGAVPRAYTVSHAWVVPWWRRLIESVAGGK